MTVQVKRKRARIRKRRFAFGKVGQNFYRFSVPDICKRKADVREPEIPDLHTVDLYIIRMIVPIVSAGAAVLKENRDVACRVHLRSAVVRFSVAGIPIRFCSVYFNDFERILFGKRCS